MNEQKRQNLLNRCGPMELPGGGSASKVIPLIPVEEFFDGAEGEAGILCNVPAAPSDDDVLELLRAIQAKPGVSDVRVAITQCDDECWPFSDTIVVVTKAAIADVITWFPEDMAPDECFERPSERLSYEQLDVPAGSHEVWLWFD